MVILGTVDNYRSRNRFNVHYHLNTPHSQCQGHLGHVTVAAPSVLCLHPSAVVGMIELDQILDKWLTYLSSL